MGWWSVPENNQLLVGDDVLDATRRFLKDFSDSYKENLERKPSLAELEYALNLAFKHNVNDEILSDFEELEVKQVSIKTVKRPKRGKPKPGDIIAFKLNNGRFGFGRFVSDVSIGAVIEVFDYFSDQPIFDYTMLGKWLFPPITIDSYSLLETMKDGDWRIIGQTKDYVPDERIKDVKFIYGEYPNNLIATNAFDKDSPISAIEAQKYTSYSPHGDFDVKKMISDHF